MYELRGVTKRYTRGKDTVHALDAVDLTVPDGDRLVIQGPTGGGKSTLLQMIGALDRPTEGEIVLDGVDLAKLSEAKLTKVRSENIGFVFQSFNLIPVLTALENVELPLKLTSLPRARRREMALTALKLVGLDDRTDHFPRQLSGGQEQRVAIARAIVTDPDVILADEPTGNLDANSARDVLTLLQRLNREFNKTIIMVTHDPHSAAAASRLIHLDKGKFVEPSAVTATPTPLATAPA